MLRESLTCCKRLCSKLKWEYLSVIERSLCPIISLTSLRFDPAKSKFEQYVCLKFNYHSCQTHHVTLPMCINEVFLFFIAVQILEFESKCWIFLPDTINHKRFTSILLTIFMNKEKWKRQGVWAREFVRFPNNNALYVNNQHEDIQNFFRNIIKLPY